MEKRPSAQRGKGNLHGLGVERLLAWQRCKYFESDARICNEVCDLRFSEEYVFSVCARVAQQPRPATPYEHWCTCARAAATLHVYFGLGVLVIIIFRLFRLALHLFLTSSFSGSFVFNNPLSHPTPPPLNPNPLLAVWKASFVLTRTRSPSRNAL